ncbi:unnamed protein product [marine sediment metagenome]|uniref:Uncharacterized protein n=1 Tax=marine sediment metagenome TaxID=412755 RepID=X1IF95_9ZZZZ
MTVLELTKLLRWRDPYAEIHVCHFARRAGKNIPIIRPLAEVRWIDGRLCLVEEDDRKLYLADR